MVMGQQAGRQGGHSLHAMHYVVRTGVAVLGKRRKFPLVHAVSPSAIKSGWRAINSSPTCVPHLTQAISPLIETEAYETYRLAGHGGTSRSELVSEMATAPSPASGPRHAEAKGSRRFDVVAPCAVTNAGLPIGGPVPESGPGVFSPGNGVA